MSTAIMTQWGMGVKSWMDSVQSNATSAPAPASASYSLASHRFLVKISGHVSVLGCLIYSSHKGGRIITVTSILISSLLRVSQSLLSFQKGCRSKHNYTRPRLSNITVFSSSYGIEGLLSTKSTLYDCSHAAVQFWHLILGDIISLICRCSGSCEGGGGGMNAALLIEEH